MRAEEAMTTVRRMTQKLSHRGPDDEGYFQEAGAGLYFGHRRLSIIDLSHEGHQPMVSASGRYVIAFNGEVYNHSRLRAELESSGIAFRGHSDTEVMLGAFDRWGVRGAVERFIGMFVFALWDRERRTLTLGRDRLGIKPLYFGWIQRNFAFGSELKALREVPGFSNPVNRNALTLLLRYNCIPAPYSIFDHIYKLMPGMLLTLDARAVQVPMSLEDISVHSASYWSALDVIQSACGDRVSISAEEATEQLDELLRDAVALRMEADVPLGAFLSGGVDSSTVVALMQAQSSRPVRTFSIGFRDFNFDEAPHAKAIARHLGTEHTELYVTPQEAMNVIPLLPQIYDEPFSDSSQIPTFLVSKIARRHVTVSLSGDGGDELFAGYNRYFWGRRLWSIMGPIPTPLRHAFAGALRFTPKVWGGVLERVMPLFPPQLRVNNPRDKIRRLADVIALDSADALYARLVSHWHDPTAVVLHGHEPPVTVTDSKDRQPDDYVERMMYKDLVSYLPNDILTKLDRASMAVSLEARVPLLDHRVVEFSWRLPLGMKIRKGEGKWLLRQVLYKYVPRELIERPKQGFGIPLEHWLRGPLRDWAESLLDERKLREGGYFDPVPIRQKWAEHLSGRQANQYYLWDILMFQAWSEAQN